MNIQYAFLLKYIKTPAEIQRVFVANDSNFDRNPLRGCNYGLEGVHF